MKNLDETNKQLNALTLGGVELEEVSLTDSTGSTNIFFDPALLTPVDGAPIRAEGRRVEQRGKGFSRFIADKITKL